MTKWCCMLYQLYSWLPPCVISLNSCASFKSILLIFSHLLMAFSRVVETLCDFLCFICLDLSRWKSRRNSKSLPLKSIPVSCPLFRESIIVTSRIYRKFARMASALCQPRTNSCLTKVPSFNRSTHIAFPIRQELSHEDIKLCQSLYRPSIQ
jgi:hypothetical protein